MKKILHLLFSNDYGGAERVVIDICKGLSSKYTFSYCSPAGPIQNELSQAQITSITFTSRNLLTLVRQVKKFQPDIIHAHDFKATVVANLLFGKLPVIAHIHQSPSWQTQVNWRTRLFRYAGCRSASVLYVSAAARDAFALKSAFSHTKVIENGVAMRHLRAEAQAVICQQYDLLFVGRLETVKNPMRFITIVQELLQQLPNLKVGILGAGHLEPAIKVKIASICQIDLIGFKQNPYPYIANTRVLLSTSNADAFGLTVIEAAVLATIPVVPNIAGIRETAKRVNGLVYDSDKQAVELLSGLLSSPTRQREVLGTIEQADLAYFDRQRFVMDIESAYQDVFNGK